LKFLLIDDNPADRILAQRLLAQELPGMSAVEVFDEAGFARALEQANGYAAVVTDHVLRWTVGLRVLRRIKARWPDCPVIFFTGSGNEALAVEALKAGADDYVSKSAAQSDRLPHAVRQAIERTSRARRLADAVRHRDALHQFVERRLQATSLEDIYDAALDAIAAALRCDRAAILLTDETGVMRFVASRGLSETYRKAVEGHSPWPAGVESPPPVCLANVCTAEIQEGLKSIMAAERIHAVGFIPLMIHGKLGGKFMTYYGAPHDFAREEIDFSLNIARQLALGVERKRAEQALEESERQLRLVTDAAPALISYIDRNKRYQFVNSQYEGWFGHRREEIIGRTMSEVLGEEAMARISPFIDRALGGETVRYEAEVPYREGGTRWIDAQYVPHRLGSGEIAGIYALVLDITDRKRSEQAVAESEARFRLLADSAPVMIWLSGTDKLCTWFNKFWLEFVGRTMEQEIGFGWTENIHPDDLEHCLTIFTGWFDSRSPFTMEYRLRRHDGEYRWVLDRGIPFYDANHALIGYIGSAIDITDRKRVEEALSEVDRRKDQFLAVLSHELRNPLAPIRNAVEIMKAPGLSKDKFDWCRNLIDQQVSHMARLLEDLLDLSRITRKSLELRKETVDLGQILRDAIQVSSPVISAARHSLITVIPPQKLPLSADRVRLTQVFVNLLNNAARYTDDGGKIELMVRTGVEGEGSSGENLVTGRALRVASSLPDPTTETRDSKLSSVTIVVRDNGIGIDADVLPRIFDMFVQGEPRAGHVQAGLGIGLTLCREIVQLHGGTIEAASAGPGKGSEFIVKLPMRVR